MTAPSTTTSPSKQPAAFLGNADAAAVVNRLRACSNVLILTHTKPDGDAFGSCLALARALRRVGVTATPVLYPPLSNALRGLAETDEIVLAAPEGPGQAMRGEPDCIVVVDTGSWSQLGPAAEFVRQRADQTIIIDHHINGNAEMASERLIDGAMPAACQIVADVVMRLLNVSSASALPTDVAEPIYLGIATDTGWFRHPSVLPSTMRLAADLLDAGVNQNALYQRTEQSDRPQRLLLAQRALNNLQYIAGGRAAVMVLRHTDFAESGANLDETGGLIDLPQAVGDVRVAALLYEPEAGLTRISMRSKAGDHPVDVNMIAHSFGGGGHKHAAGARVAKPASDVLPLLIKAIESALA
ncbi:MAG: DHH family phosphoesterase [Phycisphaerales bacterium]|nr:DHH family phosphoesterase [Phycisphaerales bacterium]